MNDKALFDEVVTSLNQQGISTNELKLYWQLLAGVPARPRTPLPAPPRPSRPASPAPPAPHVLRRARRLLWCRASRALRRAPTRAAHARRPRAPPTPPPTAAGVLHLGNIEFDPKADNATPLASAGPALAASEHVLGLQSGLLVRSWSHQVGLKRGAAFLGPFWARGLWARKARRGGARREV